MRDLPWAEVSLALLLFAGVGASLGLAIASASFVADSADFLAANVLEVPARAKLLISMILGASVALVSAIGVLLVTRGRAAESVIRVANICSPLVLFAFVRQLFDYRAWSQAPLPYLCLLAVVVLLAEQFVTRSLSSMPEGLKRWAADVEVSARVVRWLPIGIVSLASLAYAIYFAHYTILNHRRFGTAGFDLGIYVNWCYNALHGYWFRCTVLFGPDGGHFVGAHAIYAVFLWLPIYALHPGAEVLLIYQAAMCGLGGITLYLFASSLISRPAAMVVALGYLMFAPLHGPNFYDYHELLVALPFHFLLYWAIVRERYKLVPLLVLIIFAHKEDLPIGMTILGTFLLLTGVRPRLGATLAVLSAVGFVVHRFVIMPAYGNWWFAEIYKDLKPAEAGGFGPIVQTILINPAYFVKTLLTEQKLVYLLHMFAPVVFLPMRRVALLFLAMPGFIFTLLTTGYAPTLSIAFQYTGHWIPYLFAATVLALKLLRETHGAAKQWGALAAIALGILSHSTVFGAVIQHDTFVGGFQRIVFEMSDQERKLYAGFRRIADQIPQDASVAATDSEVPHVAARKDMYGLGAGHGDAEYLLVRAGGSAPYLKDAFEKHSYGLVDAYEQTFFLFKKNYLSAKNERQTAEAKKRLLP